jgi:hypothetical protein
MYLKQYFFLKSQSQQMFKIARTARNWMHTLTLLPYTSLSLATKWVAISLNEW